MKHRHLDTTEWTLAAIDSVLDRGDLPDWRELFAAIAMDCTLAEKVLHVANKHPMGGASVLAAHLVKKFHPQIKDTQIPRHLNPEPQTLPCHTSSAAV